MRTIIICIALIGALSALFGAATEPAAPSQMQAQLGVPAQTPPLPLLPRRDDPVFTEDFENEAEGWTTTDLTNPDTAWHKSDFNARDDDLLWWCGDTITGYDSLYVGYDNIWLQFLDTPVLDLSGADDGLTLTFAAYWLVEDPRRVPPPNPFDGWDGWLVMISTNGGDNFEVLQPVAPAYSANRLSAPERFWGIGQMPGWVYHSGEWEAPDDITPEPAWVDCNFNLEDYAEENVVIRFMLVTDRTVAAPFNPYLRNCGVFLDDILITDSGGDIFLSNNADDEPAPSELIPHRGPGFGDHWRLTDQDRHAGEFSMWNDDDFFNVVNVLDSPPIQLPQGASIYFQYWVHCDLPDGVHPGDNVLKDFYRIYITNDEGETWTSVTYDYNRQEAGGEGWVHYVPGLPFNGNLDLDLSAYAGQTVQLRWMFITDNDHTAGNGSGLFLDDIEVISANQVARDAGMANFI
ncbi:MAG: hypothetical protein V2A61_02635, partial [Calditrichota bacterium]